MGLEDVFPRYAEYDPQIPVFCVTPQLPGSIHRFYDTSPFSPSGRYLAVTQLGDESRLPMPGDVARIHLVDLFTGEHRCVAETRAWDTQLGAQVQWGKDDHALFFNELDVRDWQPYGVRLDPVTGETQRLGGTVYMLSADGRWAASPCLKRLALTQPGYGVVIPGDMIPRNYQAAHNDGIHVTDVDSGLSTMIVSIEDLVNGAGLSQPVYGKGSFYVFHVKWNPQGSRLMAILRWLPHRTDGFEWWPWRLGRPRLLDHLGRTRRDLIVTFKPDGGDIHLAVPPEEWAKGGHHPNWCPDGRRILMNLEPNRDGMRFVVVDYDGRNQTILCRDNLGSGHPTMHPDGVHILTDAYPDEPMARGDGTSPLRWLDATACQEQVLVHMPAKPRYLGPRRALRVDLHPAWDRTYRYVAFNGCPGDGLRRVFVADLSALQ